MDQPGKSLKANTAWGVLANALYALGRMLVFILPAKFLPPADIGHYALALALVTPLSYLCNMDLRLVWVTTPPGGPDFGFFVACQRLGNLLFGLALLLVMAWAYFTQPPFTVTLIAFLGLVRIVESWANLHLAVLQKAELMRKVALSQFLKTMLLLAWMAGVFKLQQGLILIIAGWYGVFLLIYRVYDRRQAATLVSVQPLLDQAVMRRLLSGAFALGVFLALTTLNDGLGRFFIKKWYPEEQVAFFAGITYFLTALILLQSGINQSVMPRLSRAFDLDRPHFRRLLLKLLAGAWFMTLIQLLLALFVGRELLLLLYQPAYAQYAWLLPPAALAGGLYLTAMVLGDAITAARRYRSRMFAVALGVSVNFTLCALLVKPYGLAGAVWALAASALAIATACGMALAKVGSVKKE